MSQVIYEDKPRGLLAATSVSDPADHGIHDTLCGNHDVRQESKSYIRGTQRVGQRHIQTP